jgi:hypothetical protein
VQVSTTGAAVRGDEGCKAGGCAAVDVTGLPLAAAVVPASTHENVTTELLLGVLGEQGQAKRLQLVLVDRGVTVRTARSLSHASRAGAKVGFPRFAAKHRQTPRFRLRAKYSADEKPPVRFVGTKALHFPVLGRSYLARS